MHSMQPELASEPECLRAISEWLAAIHTNVPCLSSCPNYTFLRHHLSALLGRPTAGT